MSNNSLVGIVEVTINSALKRLSKVEGLDRQSLYSEFREWIDAIDSTNKEYDVLYINKIN